MDNNVAVARNVFELAVKKFPQLPWVAVQYVDFLDAQRDDANARALCERSLDVLRSEAAGEVWARYLELETSRGDLVAVARVNARRRAALQVREGDTVRRDGGGDTVGETVRERQWEETVGETQWETQ
jgi:hypothetical protein